MNISYRSFLKLLLFVLVFSYIYSIKYRFQLSSIVVLGVCGFLLTLYTRVKFNFILPRKIWNIVMMLLGFCFLYILVVLINIQCDFYFIKEFVILDLLTLFAVYPIFVLLKKIYRVITFLVIAKYCILAVTLQNLLAILMFFFPTLNSFLLNLLAPSDLEMTIVENAYGFRLIGFGTAFFASGVINSVALILCAVIINFSVLSRKQLIEYIIIYLFVFLIGLMMSRTTLVGFVLSLFAFCYKAKIWRFKVALRLRVILKSMLLTCLIIYIVLCLFPSAYKDRMNTIIRFGFEFVYNYAESGKLETSSSNGLLRMYNKIPHNLKTWLIGDGFYRNPENPTRGYYMGTDIGFVRIIFCVGLLGLLYFILFQWVVVHYVSNNNEYSLRFFFILLFILFLLLNMKGVTDLFRYLILFFCTNSLPKVKAKGEDI